MTDRELIEDILRGNTNTYEQLVERYKERVFRVSMGFVHNNADADDISQEVFINAFYSLRSFKGRSEFSTWLHRITINACLNFIRKQRKLSFFRNLSSPGNISKTAEYHENPYNVPGADKSLIDRQNAEQVQKAIDKLPEKQRIAFILGNYEDMPQKEIASVMHTTVGAVEQLLLRAKNNLRKQLAEYYKNFYS